MKNSIYHRAKLCCKFSTITLNKKCFGMRMIFSFEPSSQPLNLAWHQSRGTWSNACNLTQHTQIFLKLIATFLWLIFYGELPFKLFSDLHFFHSRPSSHICFLSGGAPKIEYIFQLTCTIKIEFKNKVTHQQVQCYLFNLSTYSQKSFCNILQSCVAC